MMKVGYDMYARLLKETIAELKGEAVEQKLNTDVEIEIEAYAPDTYIPLQTERMTFYQQLASCETLDEIEQVKAQLADVYGAIPKQVDNLFAVATLKLLANKAGVAKVAVKPARGEITFANRDKMMRKEVFEALSAAGERVTASPNSYGIVFSSPDFLQKTRLMDAVTEFLKSIQT